MKRSYYQDDGMTERLFSMLDEYCYSFDEYNTSSDSFGMRSIEQKLIEIIDEYYPSVLQLFEKIVEQVHEVVQTEQFIDISCFEDDFVLLYNLISSREQQIQYSDQLMEEQDYVCFDIENKRKTSFFDEYFEQSDEDFEKRKEQAERQRIFQERVDAIVRFIREHKKPVQRDTLISNLDGCSSSAISAACACEGILDYHGEYFSADNLDGLVLRTRSLKRRLDILLGNREIHHVEEVYEAIAPSYPTLMTNAYVRTPFQFFSLIKYLFPSNYSYSRPFIAASNVDIPTIPERIIRFAKNKGEISLTEVSEFNKSKGIVIDGWLRLFDEISDHLYLKNRTTLIPTQSISLSSRNIDLIGELIETELQNERFKAIRDLRCIALFPSIALPWDEWLIYSIVRKRINGIYTLTTSPQFKRAVPVVSLSKKLKAEKLSEIAKSHSAATSSSINLVVDDLDHLDELIEDMLDFDWEDMNDEF